MSKSHTVSSIHTLLARPESSHTVLLTTFRRDRHEVSTPVGMKSASGKLYFMTPATTWKVRRMAHTPQVTLALCTFRGTPLTPAVDGVARRLAGAEAKRARTYICAGIAGQLINALYALRYPGDATAVYEVRLVTTEQP